MTAHVATQETPGLIVLAQEPDFVAGRVEIRPSALEVAIDSAVSTLEPRVMQVLVALAQEPGRVIARDELIDRCWDGRIVGEGAITRCVSALRGLAHGHGDPFEIETLSKVGYRLLLRAAEPRPSSEPEGAGDAPPVTGSLPTGASPARLRLSRPWLIALAGALLVIAGALSAWLLQQRPPAPVATHTAEAARLTQAARALMYERNRTSFAQAEHLLREAIAKEPDYAPAWSRLGIATWMWWWWTAQSDPVTQDRLKAEAIADVNRALALAPNLAEAQAAMGFILSDTNQGVPWLERAAKLDPNDPETWMWLGDARRDTFDLRGALEALSRAHTLDPAWRAVNQDYLDLLFRLRGFAEVYREIDRVAAISNDQTWAQERRAYYQYHEGQFADAATTAAAALSARPQDPYWPRTRLVILAAMVGDRALADRLIANDPLQRTNYEALAVPGSAYAQAQASPDTWWDSQIIRAQAAQLVTEGKSALLVSLYDRRFKGVPDFIDHCPCYNHGPLSVGPVLAVAMRKVGRDRDADQLLAALSEKNAILEAQGDLWLGTALTRAQISALSGDTPKAIDLLNDALERGWKGQDLGIIDLGADPVFAGLHGDVQFQSVLKLFNEARAVEAARFAKIDLSSAL